MIVLGTCRPADSALACGTSPEEPGTPTQEQSDGEEREEESLVSQVNLRNTEDLGSEEDSCSGETSIRRTGTKRFELHQNLNGIYRNQNLFIYMTFLILKQISFFLPYG